MAIEPERVTSACDAMVRMEVLQKNGNFLTRPGGCSRWVKEECSELFRASSDLSILEPDNWGAACAAGYDLRRNLGADEVSGQVFQMLSQLDHPRQIAKPPDGEAYVSAQRYFSPLWKFSHHFGIFRTTLEISHNFGIFLIASGNSNDLEKRGGMSCRHVAPLEVQNDFDCLVNLEL
jgi:hypothetical protein